MRIITDLQCCEYSSPGHPERPQRISRTVERLRRQSTLSLTWEKPGPVQDEPILRAHSSRLWERLKHPADFDTDTPAHPNIVEHARRSVAGALTALQFARQGETAFSLLRPPGHHATHDQSMGFCYLNNIAVAVLEARAAGIKSVAVLDFDVHHGNGTEAILLDRPGCAFYSIHQFPAYPGTGRQHRRNCRNFPLPPHTPRLVYRAEIEKALSEIRTLKPDLLAVSAGFDAYHGDPLCQEELELEDFHWIGQAIRKLNVPAFSVLEGGYSDDLPELVLAYLCGLEEKPL